MKILAGVDSTSGLYSSEEVSGRVALVNAAARIAAWPYFVPLSKMEHILKEGPRALDDLVHGMMMTHRYTCMGCWV